MPRAARGENSWSTIARNYLTKRYCLTLLGRQRDVINTTYDVGTTVIFDDVAGHDAYQAHPLHNEVHKGEPNAHERHGKLRSCGRIELATDSSTVDTDQSKGFIPALMSRTLTMVPGG
jgi:hypothetical protein